MPFPPFDYCAICDGIRQEMGGKLTILGFFGMTPYVEVVVGNPAQPLALALIAGFPPVADVRIPYVHSFVITQPDGRVVQQLNAGPLNVMQNRPGFVVFGFVIPPPYSFGQYSIRILVNNEPKLDTSFRLRSATASELGGISGMTLPPPLGRPN